MYSIVAMYYPTGHTSCYSSVLVKTHFDKVVTIKVLRRVLFEYP